MFGKRPMHYGAYAMVLILALATVGVGYGLWSKVLTIEGIVKTGEVNAIFTIEEIDEGDAGLVADNGIDEDKEVEGKDIAECSVKLLDGLENPGPQLMEITIENGYPSFSCFVNFDIDNTGTIPIKVDQPILGPVPVGLRVEFLTGNVGTEGCYYDEVDGSAVPPVDKHPQLEPGEMTFCTIWVHVEQEAPQKETLTFTARIPVHQWNEYSTWPHLPLWP